MKKQFEVIEVPADGHKRWYGGAYCLTFVYSPKGNFLLKGYSYESDNYMKQNFPICFYRQVLYNTNKICGRTSSSILLLRLKRPATHFGKRELFNFSDGCPLTIIAPRLTAKNYNPKYVVRAYDYHTNVNSINLKFKRFPTKWIPEFDYLIEKYTKENKE